MNARWLLRAALVVVLLAGVGFLAAGAYQAGLAAGLAADGAAPAPGYGYGWYPGGFGFGFFGFLGLILFLFLLFGLLRAAFWGGPGRGGWAGPGRWRDGDQGHRHPFESRARDAFDAWHREAHEGPAAGATGTRADRSTFGSA